MRFPNSFNGSKKIFLAEILALITSVLMIIGAIVAINSVKAESGDGFVGSLVGGGAILLVGGIIAIVAFIIQLLGINACAKDEPAFKTALYAILAGIVLGIISGATSGAVKEVFSAIGSVASLCATIFVIKGFINLANQLGRSDVASLGKKVLYICVALALVGIVLSIVSAIVTPAEITLDSISSYKTVQVITIISAIVGIVEAVIYILFLKKSKDMLAA